MKKTFAIGIDIGGTNIRVGLIDSTAKILCQKQVRISVIRDITVLEQVYRLIDEVLGNCKITKNRISGIGVSFAAVVDKKTGRVMFFPKPEMKKWAGISITGSLKKRYGVPVAIDIDTIVATIGENWAGTGKKCKRFALLTLGTGIGSGYVVDGKVQYGQNGLWAEFGHMIVSDTKSRCACGVKGCVHSMISGPGIANWARELLRGKKTKSLIMKLAGNKPENITSEMVFQSARKNDKTALCIIKNSGQLLGRLVVNVVNAVTPEKIVIGGGMSRESGLLVPAAQKFLDEHCWTIKKKLIKTELVVSPIGDDAGILGAAKMIFEVLSKVK